MEDSAIYLHHITYSHHGLPLFQDLCAALPSGQTAALVAPNGAGKSTLLQIMAGLLAPHQGQVSLKGINVYQAPKLAKKIIGYCPHHPKLYGHLTLDENLYYLARLRNLTKPQTVTATQKIKSRLNLTDFGQCLCHQLSSGTQQRAGIAASLIHQPKIMLLDEPTSLCDTQHQAIIFEALKAYQTPDTTCFFSTQNMTEAQTHCDIIYTIKNKTLKPYT